MIRIEGGFQDYHDEGYHGYFLMTTNLHELPITGPGVLLHFDFQVPVMVWIVSVICDWLFLGAVAWLPEAQVAGDELFLVG